MVIGSHVLLWEMWEKGHSRRSIVSRSFVWLLECHGMAIGSHVLLWEMWEKGHSQRSIVSRSSQLSLGKFIANTSLAEIRESKILLFFKAL